MLRVFSCINEEHDLRLVVIAGVICLLSAFTALALFSRALADERRRHRWVCATAFVSGTGIWATHFIAMLGFRPGFPIGYDLVPTLVSIVLAILVSGLGWLIASEGGQWARLAGGGAIGLGVGVMHYVGMAALEIPAMVLWSGSRVTVSILIGITVCALALVAHRRDGRGLPWRSGGVLTLGICGLHFTGMTAASILPNSLVDVPARTVGTGALTTAVTALALIILIVSAAVLTLDRRLAQRTIEEGCRLKRFVNASVDGLVIIDGDRVIDANIAFATLAGYSDVVLLPRKVTSLFPELDLDGLSLWTDDRAVETVLSRQKGGECAVELLLRRIEWNGQELRALSVRDITERLAASKRIAHLAGHDSLTGLPNRVVLAESLGGMIEAGVENGISIAVFCIGLDGFKAINDIHGHPAGDGVLVEVALRLRSATRGRDLIVRLGGDEFAIVQSGSSQPLQARKLAERIHDAFVAPFSVAGKAISIGTSIGVSICPGDSADPVELMKNADIALTRAKQDGRGVTRFFEPAMDKALRERHQLGLDLRDAIERGELRIHYQPIARLETEIVTGFEALARWEHPELGEISPSIFVPIAEEDGLIAKLGLQILTEAVAEASRWHSSLTLSVNLSPGQFLQPDLVEQIRQALAASGLDPHRLDLEITEGLLIRDTENALATLGELKALGVSITMDDFGTGYSSLSYFRMFPFDKVKIDQSFVREMIESRPARAIIRAVIGLGHELGMQVVAEGVETRVQLEALREDGCDLVQGYLVSQPRPIRQFDGFVLSVADEGNQLERAA
jgi:diguanylate cyclase (GGDEF)-like protein/PAS domain S-box-containing protein